MDIIIEAQKSYNEWYKKACLLALKLNEEGTSMSWMIIEGVSMAKTDEFFVPKDRTSRSSNKQDSGWLNRLYGMSLADEDGSGNVKVF